MNLWRAICWAGLLAVGGLPTWAVGAPDAGGAVAGLASGHAADGASVAAGVVARAASSPATPFFRPLEGRSAWLLGDQLLSRDDKAFLASLPEVRVGVARQGFAPFEVVGSDGEISGIHVEMLVHLARSLGLKLRPVVFDRWSDTLEAARRRDVDVLMSMGITAERASYLEFTLGSTPSSSALFGRAGAGAASPPPEAARVVIERGFVANTYVPRLFPQARIVPAESTDDALRAVVQGQADYYAGSLLPGVAALARLGLRDVAVKRLLSYGSGHYHFAVRKDWARLATLLSLGVSGLRAAPTAGWQAAVAGLPPDLAPQWPKTLTQQQAAVLIERPVWRVGAVQRPGPFSEVDPLGRHVGLGAEFVEAVARRLGVGVQLVPFASVAAMRLALRENRIDLIGFHALTDADSAAGPGGLAQSVAFFETPQVLMARHDAPMYWDLSSLGGRRLALAAQHPMRALIAQRHPELRIVEFGDDAAAMDAVADGAAEATLQTKLSASRRIHADNDGVLRVVTELPDLKAPYGFAAAPLASGLVPLINEVLADIDPTERQRMQQRWLAQEPAPPFPWRRYLPAIAVGVVAVLGLALATVLWMRRLQREIEARRQSEQALADVSANLPCVAFRTVFDARGDVCGNHFSPSARSVLGVALDPARTLLQNLRAGLSAADLQAAQARAVDQLKSGEHASMTACYAHPDGRRRWIHGESVRQPSRPEIGEPVGGYTLTGYLADVTVERDLQEGLLRAEQARHQWLASASEELREPAERLGQALQALEPTDPLPTDHLAVHSLRVARDAQWALSQLLADVHAAARLDQGDLVLRPETVVVAVLVAELDAALRTWTAHKGLDWQCRTAPDVPRHIQADPIRLRQVAFNLLSNAVKYTETGGVELSLAMDASGTVASDLVLSVADTGVGIAHDRLQHLFTPYRATQGTAGVMAGSTGLGLSVCRRLIDLMGGSIQVDSTPGQGTRVVVRLPCDIQTRQPSPSPNPAIP